MTLNLPDKTVSFECQPCNGTGMIIVDGTRYYCPKCDGDGDTWQISTTVNEPIGDWNATE